jgi:hypothetical protein
MAFSGSVTVMLQPGDRLSDVVCEASLLHPECLQSYSLEQKMVLTQYKHIIYHHKFPDSS